MSELLWQQWLEQYSHLSKKVEKKRPLIKNKKRRVSSLLYCKCLPWVTWICKCFGLGIYITTVTWQLLNVDTELVTLGNNWKINRHCKNESNLQSDQCVFWLKHCIQILLSKINKSQLKYMQPYSRWISNHYCILSSVFTHENHLHSRKYIHTHKRLSCNFALVPHVEWEKKKEEVQTLLRDEMARQ